MSMFHHQVDAVKEEQAEVKAIKVQNTYVSPTP